MGLRQSPFLVYQEVGEIGKKNSSPLFADTLKVFSVSFVTTTQKAFLTEPAGMVGTGMSLSRLCSLPVDQTFSFQLLCHPYLFLLFQYQEAVTNNSQFQHTLYLQITCSKLGVGRKGKKNKYNCNYNINIYLKTYFPT